MYKELLPIILAAVLNCTRGWVRSGRVLEVRSTRCATDLVRLKGLPPYLGAGALVGVLVCVP